MGSDGHTFGYRGGIAPMLWVLVALSAIELVVVHLLLAIWWRAVAVVVSIVTLAGMAWLVRAIASFDRRPVLIARDHVLLRVGTLRSVTIPHARIAGVRLDGWSGEDIRRRSTLNLALLAWPNVVVDLREPLPGHRAILMIAHRLDDPAGFAAAMERVGRNA